MKESKRATQLIFLACGIALSSWAPMIPLAKDRLSLIDSELGLLMLFLGFGAIVAMPITDWFIQKFGCRTAISAASVLISLSLPFLMIIKNWTSMSICLFLFGSGIGMIDVAMNAHGALIEKKLKKPIMSALHGLYSIGGLLGPILFGFIMKINIPTIYSAVIISIIILLIVFSQYKTLLSKSEEKNIQKSEQEFTESRLKKKGGWLNPVLLIVGMMCFIGFSSEGALLDWGALLLRDTKGINEKFAGIGFACFSIAMAAMRLIGDKILSKFDQGSVVFYGSIIVFIGYLMAILSPSIPLSLLGFVLIGIGGANIVPVFFSVAASIKNVNISTAISVVTTLGYTGMLVGPALLGIVSQHYSTSVALFIAGLLLLVVGIAFKFSNLSSFLKEKK
ncbi:hypothetical protein BBI01_17965 [Chryseobacterium artocarpi]|uniref:Major facilitator superfamily (MFS) profile domain-containing protein n=1 Tax=Chryseobacterium artocarpi TaxID=1414727 RepID=A0A1B8ZC42_9FLAO|nr:MFS transporter [Chryseobacterium artocarpi]OCA69096.1 hypothetical protein BBI01_17965 [Chryseobacterium artocarpi]